MEIEQTDTPNSDNKFGNPESKSDRFKPGKGKQKEARLKASIAPETKSLRESWEETLTHKKTAEPESANTANNSTETPARETVLPLRDNIEQEISLHPDAQDIHERLQEGRDEDEVVEDTKPDPKWEAWSTPGKAEQLVKDIAVPAADIRAETPIAAPATETGPAIATPMPAPETRLNMPFSRTESQPGVSSQPFEQSTIASTPNVANVLNSTSSSTPEFQQNLPKEAQEIMQRMQVPSDHHIEQSTWHNIEVDNKTGQAVEQPGFDYGQEFLQEQKAEVASKPNFEEPEEAEEVAAASGQLAVGTSEMPALNPNLSVMTDTPSAKDRNESYPTRPTSSAGLGSSMADPVLWIILIVIVIAIFFAVVL